ncbi:hypothetical protein GGX14DRAFT_404127 [Mycena pura]|uniref:Uncharacterized protein n=1 Tax=Mycena pura TaxID=153505 RepID=A0AAD6Y0G0_9AGAR|nr:hypothetical protein GGX14DRAFT_404127 [Mycena pura]
MDWSHELGLESGTSWSPGLDWSRGVGLESGLGQHFAAISGEALVTPQAHGPGREKLADVVKIINRRVQVPPLAALWLSCPEDILETSPGHWLEERGGCPGTVEAEGKTSWVIGGKYLVVSNPGSNCILTELGHTLGSAKWSIASLNAYSETGATFRVLDSLHDDDGYSFNSFTYDIYIVWRGNTSLVSIGDSEVYGFADACYALKLWIQRE